MWMKSKTGMWHKMGDEYEGTGQLASCQSYNLDRLNPLTGESVENPPAGEKVCKKCSSPTGMKKKPTRWCTRCNGGVMHDRRNKPAKCGNCGKIEKAVI